MSRKTILGVMLVSATLLGADSKFIDMRTGVIVNLDQATNVDFPTDVDAHVTLDRASNPRTDTRDTDAISDLKNATSDRNLWVQVNGGGTLLVNIAKVQEVLYVPNCPTNCTLRLVGPRGTTLGTINVASAPSVLRNAMKTRAVRK
jgi:hypothetical protein